MAIQLEDQECQSGTGPSEDKKGWKMVYGKYRQLRTET